MGKNPKKVEEEEERKKRGKYERIVGEEAKKNDHLILILRNHLFRCLFLCF